MQLRAVASTHVGMRRKANEDRYGLAPDLGLYLVADGMGGHKAGQVASQMAAEAAIRAIDALDGASVSLAEKLRHSVAAANREIFNAAQAQPELAGMGTTLVSILVSEERVALAHVGDSRAYLVRGDRIRGLTDDHSVVGELLRRHEISEEAARGHPHRHVLTRALGVRPQTEPDLAEMTPQEGDIFVLCSDGLTSVVRDEEIAQFVLRETDLQSACEKLVAEANARGGPDNVTVLLIRCEKSAP